MLRKRSTPPCRTWPRSSKRPHADCQVRLRVGLTGGIGSGKTVVGERFEHNGALLIDADALARQAVAPGSEGLRAVLARWPAVAGPDGDLDRAALAHIVFADGAAREELNAIVHPAVRALGERIEASATQDRIVVHEVPLLFETGFDRRCDATVLVVAPEALRIARVQARSGLAPEEIERRMRAQIDPALACGQATFVIENAGTLEELRAATDRVWERLEGLRSEAGSRNRSLPGR